MKVGFLYTEVETVLWNETYETYWKVNLNKMNFVTTLVSIFLINKQKYISYILINVTLKRVYRNS